MSNRYNEFLIQNKFVFAGVVKLHQLLVSMSLKRLSMSLEQASVPRPFLHSVCAVVAMGTAQGS